MSMTAEQRKEWAYGILDPWIRGHEAGDVWAALDGVREALDHTLGCNGWQCGDWSHRHHPNQVIGPESKDCDLLVPCGDCETYREGTSGAFATRPALDSLGIVEEYLEGLV